MYVCAEGLHLRALAVCSPLAGPGGSCSARPGPKFLYKQMEAVKGGFKILKYFMGVPEIPEWGTGVSAEQL